MADYRLHPPDDVENTGIMGICDIDDFAARLFGNHHGGCNAGDIIDIDDVASIATAVVIAEQACGEIINIANTHNSSIFDIVRWMEAVVGHRAIFDIIDRGAGYAIDTDRIQASLRRCRISFSGDYLYRTIRKYYAQNDPIKT